MRMGDTWIDAEYGDYRLVRYVTGETRIENEKHGTASTWLNADEQANIKAEPVLMRDWAMDDDLDEE